MSGFRRALCVPLGTPASPLRLTSLGQIVCLHGPAASRLSCASILLCDLRRKGASRGFRGGRFSASLNPRLVAKETHANKGEFWIRSF